MPSGRVSGKKAAELAARAIVEGLYRDLVNPGGYAGPAFTPQTFKIGKHVRALLPMHVLHMSKASLDAGEAEAVRLWKELNGLEG